MRSHHIRSNAAGISGRYNNAADTRPSRRERSAQKEPDGTPVRNRERLIIATLWAGRLNSCSYFA